MTQSKQNQSVELEAVSNERLVLFLLTGQILFFALALSLLEIAGTSLFLVNFGSRTLPYVYIAVAALVSLLYYGYAKFQKRWVLAKVATVAEVIFAGIFFLAWLGLTVFKFQWIFFALMIIFALGYQMALVIIGGQATRLLNMRQMKRLFPIVLTGLIVGFMAGGLLLPLLTFLLGKTENLLLAAGVSMLISLTLLLATTNKFHPRLSRLSIDKAVGQPTKSLPQLLKKRYVKLVFAYQMLSVVGIQLILFIFLYQAELNFTVVEELTRFFGNFTLFLNLLLLLFLTAPAGFLLNRYGLRLGVAANPIVVTVLVIAMVVINPVLGISGILFFWLAVGTRVFNIMLSVGITTPSIKAIYQSISAEERPVVETAVESIGVPVAIGIAGLILLGFNSIYSLTFTHLILFTALVTVFWAVMGFVLYRDYTGALLRILSRRALGEAELSLDDGSSLAVVENLLQSDNIRDVRLGLDMLERTEHESLEPHLVNLLGHPQAVVRAESMARAEHRKLDTFLPLLQSGLAAETDPLIKGASLRTLAALQETGAIDQLTPYLDDPHPDIRMGAMVGLLRYGGIPGVLTAGERLTELEQDPDPARRIFVAGVIGQVGIKNFYQPLLFLLQDEDPNVRLAALVAAEQVHHPRLLPAIINNLSSLVTRSATMAALVASGEAIFPITAKALAYEIEYEEEDVIRLVHVCGNIKGDGVIEILKPHLNHPDDDVQYAVLAALDLCGYQAVSADELAEIELTLKGEVEHGLRTLFAKQDIGNDKCLAHLHRALDYEFEQARRRVFLLLSFVYDSRAILRAKDQLMWGSQSEEQTLALKTLDVTLSGKQKELVFPLVDQSKPLDERTRQLVKLFTLRHAPRDQRLNEIITDPEGVWTHGWTRACAIYAAGKLGVDTSVEAVEEALALNEHPIRETAAWALHRLAPEKYRAHAVKLATDANPHVAQLAATLQ